MLCVSHHAAAPCQQRSLQKTWAPPIIMSYRCPEYSRVLTRASQWARLMCALRRQPRLEGQPWLQRAIQTVCAHRPAYCAAEAHATGLNHSRTRSDGRILSSTHSPTYLERRADVRLGVVEEDHRQPLHVLGLTTCNRDAWQTTCNTDTRHDCAIGPCESSADAFEIGECVAWSVPQRNA